MYFLERILGLQHVTIVANKLTLKPLFENARTYIPTSDHLFRTEKQSAATLALMKTDEGKLVQTAGGTNLQVSTFSVYLELGIAGLSLLAICSIILFALVWIPRLLFRKLQGVKHLSVRVLPFAAVLSLIFTVVVVMVGGREILQNFGNATVYSVGLTIFSILFAVASFLGLLAVLRTDRREMNAGAYWHSLICSAVLSILSIYLMYWGFIGYRSWV